MTDRRQFLSSVTFTLGTAALGSGIPFAVVQAAPAACLVDASAWPDACGDWQLDDICMAYPPYSMPMGAAVQKATAMHVAESADSHWVA